MKFPLSRNLAKACSHDNGGNTREQTHKASEDLGSELLYSSQLPTCHMTEANYVSMLSHFNHFSCVRLFVAL